MRLYTGSYSQTDFTLTQPDVLGPIVQKWEDGLRTSGENGELEWWYFDVKFEDGSLFVCYFWKIHPLKDIYFIGMNYNTPGGEELFQMKFFDEKQIELISEEFLKKGQLLMPFSGLAPSKLKKNQW